MSIVNKLSSLFGGGSCCKKQKSRKPKRRSKGKNKRGTKKCRSGKKCRTGGGLLGLGSGSMLRKAVVPLGLLALQRLSSKNSSRKYKRRRYSNKLIKK